MLKQFNYKVGFKVKKLIKNIKNIFISTKRREAFETKKNWKAAEKLCLENFKNSDIVSGLTSDDVCIDCGANVGEVSEVLANSGAFVYCFEPDSSAFNSLKKRFVNRNNIKLFKKGVYTENKQVKLYKSELSDYDNEFFSQSSSICGSKVNVETSKYEEIEVIDVCEFIESLNRRIYLLKMDIEGAEFDILEKLINKQLYNKIDYVLVETHDDSVPEIRDKAQQVRNLIKEKQIKNINLNWI